MVIINHVIDEYSKGSAVNNKSMFETLSKNSFLVFKNLKIKNLFAKLFLTIPCLKLF